MSIPPPSPQEIEAAIKRNTTRLKRAQTAFRKNPNFANDEKVHEAQSDLNSWLSFNNPIKVGPDKTACVCQEPKDESFLRGKYRLEIDVCKFGSSGKREPDWSETCVTTKAGIAERFETLAKCYGSLISTEARREQKSREPVRQILRKVRKKVAKKCDRDCWSQNYNQAQVQFLCLQDITLDHEIEFALKRLYLAAAHIVKTIELLERDE